MIQSKGSNCRAGHVPLPREEVRKRCQGKFGQRLLAEQRGSQAFCACPKDFGDKPPWESWFPEHHQLRVSCSDLLRQLAAAVDYCGGLAGVERLQHRRDVTVRQMEIEHRRVEGE